MEHLMDNGVDRVVALVDMDCFYVQVEQQINPELKDKPCVVAQYKTYKGGGIIAVSYEARAYGVTRNMWADDAKKLCPDLQVARVRESHGKADLTCYREASSKVIEVMSRFAVIERASIDEAYMDLTASVKQRLEVMADKPIEIQNLTTTFVEGYPQAADPQDEMEEAAAPKDALRLQGLSQWMDTLPPTTQRNNAELQLAVGAVIIEEMRAAVLQNTGFKCSAGISHNKVLSKLACGLNKPNRQTILPLSSVPELFNCLPIGKIRHLGGKLGVSVSETLKVDNIGELTKFSQDHLVQKFGMKTGQWLYNLCRGIEFEPVKPRQLAKSIGCSKNFPGKESLDTKEKVQYWLQQLSLELEERLIQDRDVNGRTAKLLTVAVKQAGQTKPGGFSRCCTLARYEAERISTDSLALVKSLNCAGNHQQAWSPPLSLLHLSASKFMDTATTLPGGITGFLRTDTGPKQQPLLSSQVPCLTQQPKRPGEIMSFFQNASKRIRQEDEVELTEGAAAELKEHVKGEGKIDPSCTTAEQETLPKPKRPGAINSFFQNASKRIRQDHVELPDRAAAAELKEHVKGEGKIDPSCTTAEQETLPSISQEKGMETHDGGLVTIRGDEALHTDTMDGPCAFSEHSPALTFAPEDYIRCDRCGEEVLAWEMPEHTDYHFAQDLQTSWSSSLPSSSQSPANTKVSGDGAQCKTVQASCSKPAASHSARTPAKGKKPAGNVRIDHFFKKS